MKDYVECFIGVQKSLLDLNQVHKSFKALFSDAIRLCKSFSFTSRLVSSAYIIVKNISETLHMSFRFRMNKRGPSVGPWGTYTTLDSADFRFLPIKINILGSSS